MDLVDALFPVSYLPEHEVEASLGEEVLVSGVVFLLATKVPGSENNGPKVVGCLRPLLIGPVSNVHSYGAHAHSSPTLHGHAPVAHPAGPVLRLTCPLIAPAFLTEDLKEGRLTNSLKKKKDVYYFMFFLKYLKLFHSFFFH